MLMRVLIGVGFLKLCVSVIAVDHVRRYVMMQEAGNQLDTNNAANKTPGGSVGRCLRR